MEILENFGFDITLFAAQIVNFLILAFLFKKFLYKPLLKTLKDRQNTISKGLKDAEDAQLAKEEAEASRDKIIKKASIEAEKIIEETKLQAQGLKDSILAEAKKESEKIILQARADAESQMQDMQRQAKNASLDISEKILNKVIGGLFTASQKQEVIKRGVSMIRKSE